ncbi:MAG: hypothetical protein RRY10_04945 [Christensenellaceae bacterium]
MPFIIFVSKTPIGGFKASEDNKAVLASGKRETCGLHSRHLNHVCLLHHALWQ